MFFFFSLVRWVVWRSSSRNLSQIWLQVETTLEKSMIPVGDMLEMRYLHMATSVFFPQYGYFVGFFPPKQSFVGFEMPFFWSQGGKISLQ